MSPAEFDRILKIAILTQEVSHFEVPLYRLCSRDPRIEIKVFYLTPVGKNLFDSVYCQSIDWGEKMLDGYESQRLETTNEMRQAAIAWKADVMLVYGYSWKGIMSIIFKNRRRKIPQIHRGTLSHRVHPQKRMLEILLRPLRQFILCQFHAHHYGGSYSLRTLRKAKIPRQDVFFVPYSVDSHFFAQAADLQENIRDAQNLRQNLGWQASSRVLLLIAHHNWIKGPDIAMEIFRIWQKGDPTARFLIVGSGQMSNFMRSYAQKYFLPMTYHFAGFVPSKQTIKYYLASDLVLCSSRYETWARMVNEAMLCRRPCVINSMVGAAGGMVEDGETGFVVAQAHVESYLEKILTYFELPADRQIAMQEKARERTLEFSYEKHIDDFVHAAWHSLQKASGKKKY